MNQCNTVKVKLLASQLNTLKSVTKIATDETLRLLSYMIGDDQTNFSHRLLLTDRQVASVCKAFTNRSSANITFSKTQLSKVIQSGDSLEDFWDH